MFKMSFFFLAHPVYFDYDIDANDLSTYMHVFNHIYRQSPQSFEATPNYYICCMKGVAE